MKKQPKVVSKNCANLNSGQKEGLLALLDKYDELFDGTLGDWKTEPVGLELREGANPFHGRPFPVPVIHRDTLKKEVERLVELGAGGIEMARCFRMGLAYLHYT